MSTSDELDERIQARIAAQAELPEADSRSYETPTPAPRGSLVRSRDDFEQGGQPEQGFSSSPHPGADHDFSNLDSLFAGIGAYTVDMGREYKRYKALSQESDAEADKFLKTSDVFERDFMSLIALLQTRDMLRILIEDRKANYEVPDVLKKALAEYAAAAIRSPSISTYRSSELPVLVYDVMRQLNVSDLPAPHDLGRREMVLEIIGKALTNGRHALKSEIIKGIDEKKDIATLTKACVGSTKAKASAALYIRIAFLRRELKQFNASKGARGNKGDDSFWLSVDNQLKTMRQKYTTSHQLQCAFEVIYELDKEDYGQPVVDSEFTMLKDLDDWMVTLNQGVARVPSK